MKSSNPEASISAAANTLTIGGAINFSSVVALHAPLRTAIAATSGTISIDLSRVSEFNSAILPLLLDCLRVSAERGQVCQFQHIPPKLDAMLKMAGLELPRNA